MSFSVISWVGPYFECGLEHENKFIGMGSHPACSNDMCVKYKELTATAFCAFCGSKINEISVEKFRKEIIREDVANHFDYRLIHFLSDTQYAKEKKIHIWVLDSSKVNYGVKTFRFHDSFEDLDLFPNITSAIIETQKNFLVENYRKEHEYLKEIYGEDQVEVKWGVFNHCS